MRTAAEESFLFHFLGLQKTASGKSGFAVGLKIDASIGMVGAFSFPEGVGLVYRSNMVSCNKKISRILPSVVRVALPHGIAMFVSSMRINNPD
jgi:hypothetical protein